MRRAVPPHSLARGSLRKLLLLCSLFYPPARLVTLLQHATDCSMPHGYASKSIACRDEDFQNSFNKVLMVTWGCHVGSFVGSHARLHALSHIAPLGPMASEANRICAPHCHADDTKAKELGNREGANHGAQAQRVGAFFHFRDDLSNRTLMQARAGSRRS